MRRAAKTDMNQTEIVKALRKIGAKCYYIKEPVDLLVGFRNRNVLLEVKDSGGRLTDAQEIFFKSWNGEAYIVQSPEQAIAAVIGKEAMR